MAVGGHTPVAEAWALSPGPGECAPRWRAAESCWDAGRDRRLLDFQVKTQQRLWCQISAGAAHPVLRRSLLGRYHVRLESWLRGGAKWWRGEYEARRPGSIAMLLLLVKSLSAQNQ